MIIKRLNAVNLQVSLRITNYLRHMFPVDVSKFLIYADPNYPLYLNKIINDSRSEVFFGLFQDEKIYGFAHFKLATECVFLNNIFIDVSFRGKGAGNQLLTSSFNYLLEEETNKRFELDVFASNTKAFAWYEKMGMKETDRKNWYGTPKLLWQSPSSSHKFIVKADVNGFSGIYYEDEKVASIINDNLIFRDVNYFQEYLKTKRNERTSACLITAEELAYPLLDVALRMSIDVNKIKL